MRDLASRLREIVGADSRLQKSMPVPRRAGDGPFEATSTPGVDVDVDLPRAPGAARTAAALGGHVHESLGGACVVVDRTWTPDRSHGRRRVESYGLDSDAPLGLFDPRLASSAGWSSRVVFFDIETTGLSGGAGTIAFLVGCGWFESDGGFTVRQFLLTGPAGEPAMLEQLERIFGEASLLVTYNGRTFDVPMMDMRWAFHRRTTPTPDLPHFDMLPAARRMWGAAGDRGPATCALSSLERSVLGFHRVADVPGFEIPVRYFHFLRTGEASSLEGILEHNRHDLISLAALTSQALWLAREGPEACREPCEQIGLGRLYERSGDAARAMRAFELAAAGGDRATRRQALARLAVLLRRGDRHEEAASAWAGVLAAPGGGAQGPLSVLERRAAEALAIHHEHRAKDPVEARRYADLLKRRSSAGSRPDVDHRLGRLARKIESIEAKASSRRASPLLEP